MLRTTGSAPFDYVLDEMGASVLAAERGIDPKDLRSLTANDSTTRSASTDSSPPSPPPSGTPAAAPSSLTGGPNGAAPQSGVTSSAPTPTAAGARPDEVDFFLEYDRGTETIARLVDKLAAYAELQAVTGVGTT